MKLIKEQTKPNTKFGRVMGQTFSLHNKDKENGCYTSVTSPKTLSEKVFCKIAIRKSFWETPRKPYLTVAFLSKMIPISKLSVFLGSLNMMTSYPNLGGDVGI